MKYELQRSRRALLVAIPLVVTGAWAVAVWHGVPLSVAIGGVLLVALAWSGYLDVTYEFEVGPDDTIQFRSIARRRTLALREIRYIDARRWNRGFVTLRYAGGTVAIFRAMPGVRELVEEVRRRSPGTLVKGDL